jgi:hypothetical protein
MQAGLGARAGGDFISTERRVQLFARTKFPQPQQVRRPKPLTILTRETKGDFVYYFLAAFAGAITGLVDVTVNDLLFTALLVLMACMALGIARSRHPWRWVVIVGVFIPLTELAAFVILTVKPSRGQIYGSFLAFLPGIAGAYGGSLLRGVVDNLRQGK